MNAPIPHAIRELHLACGIAPKFILRADLARDDTIWIETEREGQSRWFRHDGDLAEVFPGDDPTLPLCAALDIPSEEVELLAWRPGRRITLKLTCEDGFEIVKGLRKKRLKSVQAAYRRVHEALDGPADFLVPMAEEAPDWCALRLGFLDLEPLAPAPRNERAYQLVGRALLSFQNKVNCQGLKRHDFASELEVLDNLSRRHERAMGNLPPSWAAAQERLQALALPPRAKFVAAHRDLHDGQLLTDGERVGLIDFDLLCSASPLLDLANLSVHLMLRALQESGRATLAAAEGCGRALLLGYGLGDSAEEHAELRALQAATFQRLALLYSMRPKWRHITPTLIQYTERCLGEPRLS
jgi:hypothetical protein